MAESPVQRSDAATPAAGAYRVVARRYRPQRFDELVGQEHVARGLSGAIVSGRIGHAYLFTGARGVGKTSAARIYAKALECARGPAAEPCNECDACVAISAGQDVDVVEVDAASNRGIDEIRQLRQNVAVRPARGRYKIYIIDEVHMLTREAFNALLKTLEEPPAHVKFVLCTTEPEKLPITILSRCQRFDFTTVDAPAIARRLAQIVAAEGAAAAPEALDLIARRAAGSMRDSQSLLEQLLGASGGTIGVDDVHAVVGTGREERIGALVAAIAARDPRAAIGALDAALAGGADPGGVLEQLIAALRDALLASVGCGPEAMLQGPGLGVDLAALGGDVGTETLLAMLQILDHAVARMRTSGHASVLAEMAIVRLAKLDDLDSLAAAVDKVASAAAAAPQAPPPRPALVAPRAEEREKKTAHLTPRPAAAAEARPAVATPAEEPPPATAPAAPRGMPAEPPAALPAASDAWREATAAVGGLAADFAATAVRATWRDDTLEVVLPADAATSASFLRRPEVSAGIGRALEAIAGRFIRQSIVLEAAAPTAVREGGTDGAARRQSPVRSQSALLRETLEHPLVVHAMAVFDAAVRKVEPPRAGENGAAPAAAGGVADEPGPTTDAEPGGACPQPYDEHEYAGIGDGADHD
jgi:DNA polymerase-3 subunit gamma/tau